jgi:hypothetical protein
MPTFRNRHLASTRENVDVREVLVSSISRHRRTTFRGFSADAAAVPSLIDAPGHMLAAETMSRRVSNAPVSLDVSGDVGIIAISNPPVNALAIPGARPDRPALLFPEERSDALLP